MTLIATTEAQRTTAETRMQDYINRGVKFAQTTLDRIMNEVPSDAIVRGRAFEFMGDNAENELDVQYVGPGGETRFSLHKHALTQVCQKAEINGAYVSHLLEQNAPWSRELLARTLNEHFANKDDLNSSRFLVRSYNGQIRGVMSDRFKRLDCRPIAEGLITTARKLGAIVSDGVASDTRTSLKIILPRVLEPTPGEFMVFGLDWSNSDYGNSANTMRAFVLRLLCFNGATLETAIRQVHLGARLPDEIVFSQKTIDYDTRAQISATVDTARALLSDGKVDQLMNAIRAASADRIDPKAKLADLRKRVGKGTADSVVEAFNSPDVENLPAGNTNWRWSNAISWVARNEEDADTRLDLEKLAGDVLRARVN